MVDLLEVPSRFPSLWITYLPPFSLCYFSPFPLWTQRWYFASMRHQGIISPTVQTWHFLLSFLCCPRSWHSFPPILSSSSKFGSLLKSWIWEVFRAKLLTASKIHTFSSIHNCFPPHIEFKYEVKFSSRYIEPSSSHLSIILIWAIYWSKTTTANWERLRGK